MSWCLLLRTITTDRCSRCTSSRSRHLGSWFRAIRFVSSIACRHGCGDVDTAQRLPNQSKVKISMSIESKLISRKRSKYCCDIFVLFDTINLILGSAPAIRSSEFVKDRGFRMTIAFRFSRLRPFSVGKRWDQNRWIGGHAAIEKSRNILKSTGADRCTIHEWATLKSHAGDGVNMYIPGKDNVAHYVLIGLQPALFPVLKISNESCS
jgi:hypothetical protein